MNGKIDKTDFNNSNGMSKYPSKVNLSNQYNSKDHINHKDSNNINKPKTKDKRII